MNKLWKSKKMVELPLDFPPSFYKRCRQKRERLGFNCWFRVNCWFNINKSFQPAFNLSIAFSGSFLLQASNESAADDCSEACSQAAWMSLYWRFRTYHQRIVQMHILYFFEIGAFALEILLCSGGCRWWNHVNKTIRSEYLFHAPVLRWSPGWWA